MPPPTVITGSGGQHWYCEDGLSTIHGLRPGLDLIGDGGFVVAPPSIHPCGQPYELVDEAVRPVSAEICELVRRYEAQVAAERVTATGKQHQSQNQNQTPDRLARLTLPEVLGLLEHVRRVRGGWKARCPLHGTPQSSESLSISQGDDGHVLIRCWGGCTFADVLRVLRVEQIARGGSV